MVAMSRQSEASNLPIQVVLAYDRWIVLAMAILAAAIWNVSEPIVFTNDSFGYLGAAKYIAGLPSNGAPYYRMPLFPLLLLATGVAHDTFTWFVLAQTALGVAMVLIFHDGLRRYSRPAALIATLGLIATFVPFVYSKSVMTEQLYLFGLMLCLSASLTFFRTGSLLHLALAAGSVGLMMLTRVQGFFVAAVVFPFLFYGQPSRWRQTAAAAGVIIILVASYAFAYSIQIKKHSWTGGGEGVSISNSIGKYLFMVPYLDAERYFGWRMVDPSNGPASAKLFELVGNAPVDLQEWWAIWQTLDKKIGIVASDNLLLRATLEACITHPAKAAVVYAHNLLAAAYRLNSPYIWQHPQVTIGNTALDAELMRSGDQSVVTPLASLINPLFRIVWLAATVLVLLSVGRHGTAWALCVALYGYNVASIAASGAPEGRIVFYSVPLLIAALATAQGTPWLLQRLRALRLQPVERGG
jgi:hypothetical protein